MMEISSIAENPVIDNLVDKIKINQLMITLSIIFKDFRIEEIVKSKYRNNQIQNLKKINSIISNIVDKESNLQQNVVFIVNILKMADQIIQKTTTDNQLENDI
jgi:hypothetical protein